MNPVRRVVGKAAAAWRLLREVLLDLEFSPMLPSWSHVASHDDATARVRRTPSRLTAAGGGLRGRVAMSVASLVWSPRVTVEACALVARHGRRIRHASNVGRLRQLADIVAFAHRWNYSPRSYVRYRFWHRDVRDHAHGFVQPQELAVIQHHLHDGLDTGLRDKQSFARLCATRDISTPTTVATLGGDTDDWPESPGRLPREDLFVKPVEGTHGSGAERWVHDAQTDRWRRRGVELDHDSLVEHCRRRARRERIMVQVCLANHPELARFSAGALCTFRVVTYAGADGDAEVLGVVLKMPGPDAEVDNLNAGGLVVGVDPVNGRLGPGRTEAPFDPPYRDHPSTGTRIDGTQLTVHTDVIDLALRAQRELPVPWSVGWDAAMTPSGALLVEGNTLWSGDLLQIAQGRGLGEDFCARTLEVADGLIGSGPVS